MIHQDVAGLYRENVQTSRNVNVPQHKNDLNDDLDGHDISKLARNPTSTKTEVVWLWPDLEVQEYTFQIRGKQFKMFPSTTFFLSDINFIAQSVLRSS